MINNILAFTIILSALLFGAVEIWSASLVLVTVFTLGLLRAFSRDSVSGDLVPANRMLLSVVWIFFLYSVFQTVPLPAAVVRVLSPTAYELRSFYSFSEVSFMSLSLHPYGTLKELPVLAGFCIVFTMTLKGLKKRDDLIRVVTVLVVAGFLLAVFGIVQKAAGNGKIYWFRELTLGGSPFGPFVNRNHFAGFIGMLVPLGLSLALVRRSREKKILFGFFTVIMTVSLFFSLSRAGIISFAVGTGVFAFLLLQSRMQQKKVWILGVFLTVLAAYLLYLGIDPIVERFYSTDISREQRLSVWAATLTAWKDFFVFGTGLGTFVHIFPLYATFPMKELWLYAHNDYLQLLLETGTAGIFLLFLAVVLFVLSLTRSSFEGRSGILRIGVFASAAAMAVHSIFDFNLHILSNLLLFGFVLGMNGALAEDREDIMQQIERRLSDRRKTDGQSEMPLSEKRKGNRRRS